MHFNPTYGSQEWRQHFQELFDDAELGVDVEEHFVEKLQGLRAGMKKEEVKPPPTKSKVQHPSDIKSAADAQAYAQVIKPHKVFWQFQTRVLSPETTQHRPREMIKKGKEYILSHYHRTFGENVDEIGAKEPDYVSDFKYQEQVDVQAKLRALRKYGYEQKQENK